jgi:ESS family glutamate:Na+ symporter
MGMGKLFGLPDGAALLPFGAFYGAHGIPQVIAGIYDTLGYWNYDEASAFGTTYATIGMLYGIIVGIAILNYGIRKGWCAAEKSGNLSKEDYTGILARENRFKFMTAYTSDIAFDPITLHFGIVMGIMLVAYGLLKILHMVPLFSGFAIYVPAILVSLVFGVVVKKTPAAEFIDNESLAHIGNLALEYLIITAIATMKLDVIMNNASAILSISLVGLILTTVILMILPKLWLKENWLENAMVMFGAWTGSTATGMMLLKISDPELETDAGPNLVAATPLWQISTQNFYLTIAPMFIVTAAGARSLALGTAGMLVAALVLGFILGRK